MADAFVDTQPGGNDVAAMVTGRTWMTLLLIAAMVATTAAALYASGSWTAADNTAMIRWAGNSAMTTLDTGGAWRLVGAKLQLGSMIGAIAFIPFFWVIAAAFERLHGSLGLLAAFVGVAAVSSAVTLHTRAFETVSVGAGAVGLALGAAQLVSLVRGGVPLYRWRGMSWAKVLLLLPWLGLLVGAVRGGAADYGSLGSGVLCGLFIGALSPLPRSDRAVTPAGQVSLPGAGALAVCLVAATAGWWLAPRPPYFQHEVVALDRSLKEYAARANPLMLRFDAFMDDALARDVPPAELIPAMQAELLPGWQALESEWSTRPVNLAIPGAQVLSSIKEYPRSQRLFLEATFKGWRTGDAAAFIEAAEHKSRLQQAREALRALDPASAAAFAR